jgi:hypothetical protein
LAVRLGSRKRLRQSRRTIPENRADARRKRMGAAAASSPARSRRASAADFPVTGYCLRRAAPLPRRRFPADFHVAGLSIRRSPPPQARISGRGERRCGESALILFLLVGRHGEVAGAIVKGRERRDSHVSPARRGSPESRSRRHGPIARIRGRATDRKICLTDERAIRSGLDRAALSSFRVCLCRVAAR